MSKTNTVYIGLGSNLEFPKNQVLSARSEIAGLDNVEEKSFSGLYESEPMGPAGQPKYINAAMGVHTSLTPLELLQALQEIESKHGRVRGPQRWTARTLDLDILLYGDLKLTSGKLTIPHPGLPERAFVLYPLHECDPGLFIPGKGKLSELIELCPSSGLRRLADGSIH